MGSRRKKRDQESRQDSGTKPSSGRETNLGAAREEKPQTDASTPNAVGKPALALSRRRKWLFRVIAVTVVPLLMLAFLELALRIFGYGYPTRFFIERPGPNEGETVYAENLDFGRRFFPPGLIKYPTTISMPKVKKEGTYRIFILGESAAMGFPDPTASFARILEVMLREAYPETRFEIVNTAMTAINSHVIREIAFECAQHQPDLFIVHVGNNEVVGQFGAAGVIGAYSPNLRVIRTSLWVKQMRVGQLLGSMMGEFSSKDGPKSWDGMAMFRKSRIGADDSRLNDMLNNFGSNLREICSAGTDAGADVLVCTIPVNLRDSAPFASEHSRDLSAERLAEWESIYNEGVSLEEAGKISEAVAKFEMAAGIDDRFADLQFRAARCLARLGKTEPAKQKFKLARDLDALRFRSETRINDAIRDAVQGMPAKAHLVDAERDFEAVSPDGIPGEDLFLEHVHMNFHGNYALAKSIFLTLANVTRSPLRNGDMPQSAPPCEAVCADRLAYTNSSRFTTESQIRSMFFDAPFNEQLDHVERDKRGDARLADLKAKMQPADLETTAAAFENALHRDPDDWMTREKFGAFLASRGDVVRALDQFRHVTRQVPHHYVAHRQQGKILLAVGKYEEAQAAFEAAIKILPDYTTVYYDLANAAAAQGNITEAIAIYEDRVNKELDKAEALSVFANFLISHGKSAEARNRLDEALKINPECATAHIIMGHLLAGEGATQGAIAHYEAAIRYRAGSAPLVSKYLEGLRKEAGNVKSIDRR